MPQAGPWSAGEFVVHEGVLPGSHRLRIRVRHAHHEFLVGQRLQFVQWGRDRGRDEVFRLDAEDTRVFVRAHEVLLSKVVVTVAGVDGLLLAGEEREKVLALLA